LHNFADLKSILKNNPPDIAGIKVFLAASNSKEVIEAREDLKKVFEIAALFNKTVVVHSELQSYIDLWMNSDLEHTINNHYMLRNRTCAIDGTKICIDIANEVGNKLSIAHVSTQEEIEFISIFRNSDNIFCELTPHHLVLDKTILPEIGNIGKVNPPLRTNKDNEVLRTAIKLGFVDYFGSDHAPHTLKEKLEDYRQSPSGFPGLETMLPVLLSEVSKGNFRLEKLIEMTSKNTAKIFDLDNTGEIKIGNFADLTIIDRDETYKIDPEKFYTKAKYSPFTNMEVTGKILQTFVNGKMFNTNDL